jgi:hypothetical protein
MLDPVTRGLLEKTIGETKDLIPTVKGIGIPKGMQIQKDEDYTLGWAIGYIMGRFLTFFIISYNRPPNEQELKEAREAIFYRTNELREAISKAE